MSVEDHHRDPVEVLAEEYAARCRSGDCPSLSSYVARHPQYAAEIEELFPSIAMMEQLRRSEGAAREALQAQRQSGGKPIDHIAGYEVLREVGSGGMGVVYEALQGSLGRRVALKVLSANAVSSPQRLRRFEREARAAAGLHHTNIVPVFGVGEQDGLHFYVMQFIDGVGLDEVILALRKLVAGESQSTSGFKGMPGARIHRDRGSSAMSTARALRDGQFADSEKLNSAARLQEVDDDTLIGLCDTATLKQKRTADSGRGSADRPSAQDGSIRTSRAPGETNGREADRGQPDPTPHVEPTSALGGGPEGEPAVRLGRQYWKSAARIGLQAADGIHYAHLQRVLHRDIKPANLLLDAQGTVWVTDFGLAKSAEQDDLTRSGDVIGTLRYMSPEQLEGRADVRSDVYALGLTLYELLTLRPAHDELSYKGLVEQITRRPMAPPRAVNRDIPLDLETIVLKAISSDPDHRYQTVGELGDDLQRFLQDHPVRARRATPIEHLWRWSRRNPVVATLAGTAALLVLLVVATTTIGYIRTTRALAREFEQRAKAENTLRISLEALDKVYKRFAPDRAIAASRVAMEDDSEEEIEAPSHLVLSRDTATLLEDILPFYDRFAEQDSRNVQLREEAAKANRRVGDIQRRLGQLPQAEEAYRTAIQKYERLARRENALSQYKRDIAATYNGLGDVYRAMQEYQKARGSHLKALETLEPTSITASAAANLRYELARTYYLLAKTPRRQAGAGNSRTPSSGARGPGNEQPGPGGASPGRKRPASTETTPEPSRWSRERCLDQAIIVLEELDREHPSTDDYLYLLALCYRDKSPRFLSEGVKKAIETLTVLIENHPQTPDYRYDLIETCTMVALRASSLPLADCPIAEKQLRRAIELADELVAAHPNVPDYARSQAKAHFRLGNVLKRMERLEDAQASYEKAVALQSSLSDHFPDASLYVVSKSYYQLYLARLLFERRQPEKARPLLESSIASLRALFDRYPALSYGRRTLRDSYELLVTALTQMGDKATADVLHQSDEYRRAMETRPSSRAGRSSASERNGQRTSLPARPTR